MKVDVNCSFCGQLFCKERKQYNQTVKRGYVAFYCSKQCQNLASSNKIRLFCHGCGIPVLRTPSHIESAKVFCGHSCAASYQNKHRTTGTRVSQLEQFIAEKLVKLYPSTQFHFNRKDAIGSELDIYLPSLGLGFELNGVHHYKPIHGQEKLAQIQSNDAKKFAACQNLEIALEIIDVSAISKFNEVTGLIVLSIITNCIDRHLKS
jgi:hypothetical protein